MTSPDPLDFTRADHARTAALYIQRATIHPINILLLCAIARVVAETEWSTLEPDTLTALLDALQFNADAALSAIDGPN